MINPGLYLHALGGMLSGPIVGAYCSSPQTEELSRVELRAEKWVTDYAAARSVTGHSCMRCSDYTEADLTAAYLAGTGDYDDE